MTHDHGESWSGVSAVAEATVARLPPGAVVIPGFVDPHLHLLAMAAARLSIDCAAATIPALLARLRAAAPGRPGDWLRAVGYDDALLAERRHPTRAELDEAVPDRPLVLHHRTGHAAVLNTPALNALALLGSRPAERDPAVRDGAGRPTGLVVGAHDLLERAVPRLTGPELADAVAATSRDLAAHGVTAVTDATATNDLDRYGLLREHLRTGRIRQRLTVLPAVAALADFAAAGLRPDSTDDAGVHIGPAKVMPEIGRLAEVDDLVRVAREYGWPVAIHAVEIDEVDAALRALARWPAPAPYRDRIEHLGLALPEQVEQVRERRATVVTQPGFVCHRGAKYLGELSPIELPWLYRIASLLAAGIPVLTSSDAPVVPARPLETVAATALRCVAGTDVVIGRDERVGVGTALRLATGGRPLVTGGPADFVVLAADPLAVEPARIPEIGVLATVVGGRIVHGSLEPQD